MNLIATLSLAAESPALSELVNPRSIQICLVFSALLFVIGLFGFMTRRNMIIIAISLTAGLGLNLVPSAVQYLPGVWKTLATSAVAPTAFLAIVLNLLIPEED